MSKIEYQQEFRASMRLLNDYINIAEKESSSYKKQIVELESAVRVAEAKQSRAERMYNDLLKEHKELLRQTEVMLEQIERVGVEEYTNNR